MDKILRSIFLDNQLWTEVIEHGVEKGIPEDVLEYLQSPDGRADLCRKVGSGSYNIAPPHTGYRPKDGGGERTFFANSPLDRMLLNAIYKWLMRNESAMVHPCCLSYQENIGVGKIVKGLAQRIETLAGMDRQAVVGRKFDIHKYFETVERGCIHKALDAVEEYHGKSSVIALLRRYYDSDIYYDSRQKRMVCGYQGIKQGCAVSSWLANVILHKLDSEVSALGGNYVRYSDDIIYIGENYSEATEVIVSNLREIGLVLNEKKIEDVVAGEFIRFLGYNIRGSEISLSSKWVDYFRHNIDVCTVRDKGLISASRAAHRIEDAKEKKRKLDALLCSAQRRVARFLYYGNGRYSWASLVLGVINRPSDIRTLNLYCMDALRAVYTGKTNIGGLGVSRTGGITRGKGRNVSANRSATAHLLNSGSSIEGWLGGYRSFWTMRRILSNRWLYRAVANNLLVKEGKGRYGNATGCGTVEELERRYEQFLNSQPDGKRFERHYARPLGDMNTLELLCGSNRADARREFEEYLETKTKYGELSKNGRGWYWQSTDYPQLVLLEEWFSE